MDEKVEMNHQGDESKRESKSSGAMSSQPKSGAPPHPDEAKRGAAKESKHQFFFD